MINMKTVFALVAATGLILSGAAFAGEKLYKATGKVQRATDTIIKLRTPAQDIEFTRDAKTKVTGELKMGVIVEVTYDKIAGRPHATEIKPAAERPATGKPY
jgi:Cu/Ag efflux protein CusF